MSATRLALRVEVLFNILKSKKLTSVICALLYNYVTAEKPTLYSMVQLKGNLIPARGQREGHLRVILVVPVTSMRVPVISLVTSRTRS